MLKLRDQIFGISGGVLAEFRLSEKWRALDEAAHDCRSFKRFYPHRIWVTGKVTKTT